MSNPYDEEPDAESPAGSFEPTQQLPPYSGYGEPAYQHPEYEQSTPQQSAAEQSAPQPSTYEQLSYGQAPAQYPVEPQPPEYQPASYPHAPAPVPSAPPSAPKAAVPGWLWPLVAATALIIGALGGALGGAIVADRSVDSEISNSPDPGASQGGKVDPAPLPAGNNDIAAVAEKLLPSTVQINAGGGGAGGATGSGFVFDNQGHVITNNHVVAGATGSGEIRVVDFDGRSHEATIIGRSLVYDLAVLKVKKAKRLKPASIGSSEDLRIGEGVVAIGSPLGLTSTVTSGIVSALNRPVTAGSDDEYSFINAIQTDAAINPGNSGGPLVNLRGQVVGVNSAIATTGGVGGTEAGNIGVGFAIPMRQVRVTAQQILQTGKATYPVIGANVNSQPGDGGAYIFEVPEGTPADRAGLREGDVVVAVNGHRVTDQIGLIVAIRSHEPGEEITLTYERRGTTRELSLVLDGQTESP